MSYSQNAPCLFDPHRRETSARACLKNHSRDLHSPTSRIIHHKLINTARYAS